MDERMLDVEQIKAYWFAEAQEALEVADHINGKRRLVLCLVLLPLGVRKAPDGIICGTS